MTAGLIHERVDLFEGVLGSRRGAVSAGPDPRDLMPDPTKLSDADLLDCWTELPAITRPLYINGHGLLRRSDILLAGPRLTNQRLTYGWKVCLAVRYRTRSAVLDLLAAQGVQPLAPDAPVFAVVVAHGPVRHHPDGSVTVNVGCKASIPHEGASLDRAVRAARAEHGRKMRDGYTGGPLTFSGPAFRRAFARRVNDGAAFRPDA